MEKYKAHLGWIQKVEIVRETEKSVFFKGHFGPERREAKMSEGGAYFDTREEAKQHLVKEYESRLETAEARVKYAREELKKIKSL